MYYSKKSGDCYNSVLDVMAAGLYDDGTDDELGKMCDYIASSLGLNEGPISPNGEMECPVMLTDDNEWYVWLAQYGWISLVDLLIRWTFEKKEYENEYGNS